MLLALHYVAQMSSFDEAKFVEKYYKSAKEIKELKLDDYSDIFSAWIQN